MQRRNNLAKLRARLKMLQSQLAACATTDGINKENILSDMKDTKLALDLYALHEAKGAQTRARIKWIEEGERNTKYFLGLEKSNYNNKTITALKDTSGQVCTSQNDVMKIQVEYYKNLYKEKFDFDEKRNHFDNFCENVDIPELSTDQQASCEGMLTADEAGNALKNMNNNSAPGSDSLTAAFYKFFWGKLKHIVVASYNESFRLETLSVSQRRAIITLIHKGKNLPRDELGNWRPISLTNTDYKILTKALAFRLQGVVKHIIFEDQVGYIKGRNISTIIRVIDDANANLLM